MPEHYMNVKTDALDNLLIPRPIQTGWELSIEPYLNWQVGIIENADCKFGDTSVPTRTRIQSGGLEPLLTLHVTHIVIMLVTQLISHTDINTCAIQVVLARHMFWID